MASTKTATSATPTIKDTVLSLVKKSWVDFVDIDEVVYPGDGMRGLRRLREDGHNIQKRYNADLGTFQYKIAR